MFPHLHLPSLRGPGQCFLEKLSIISRFDSGSIFILWQTVVAGGDVGQDRGLKDLDPAQPIIQWVKDGLGI